LPLASFICFIEIQKTRRAEAGFNGAMRDADRAIAV
jgi:hypothetical protein